MGNFPVGGIPGWQLQATTGPAGFPLQNGTPTILTWNVPNDGQMHRIFVISNLHVTVNETGGALQVASNYPDGFPFVASLHAGGGVAGSIPGNYTARTVQAGATVVLSQNSALTVGAATLWAEIWGS